MCSCQTIQQICDITLTICHICSKRCMTHIHSGNFDISQMNKIYIYTTYYNVCFHLIWHERKKMHFNNVKWIILILEASRCESVPQKLKHTAAIRLNQELLQFTNKTLLCIFHNFISSLINNGINRIVFSTHCIFSNTVEWISYSVIWKWLSGICIFRWWGGLVWLSQHSIRFRW